MADWGDSSPYIHVPHPKTRAELVGAWHGRNKIGKIVFSDKPSTIQPATPAACKFAVGDAVSLLKPRGYWGENGVVVSAPSKNGGSYMVEFDTPLGKETKPYNEDELT